MSDISKSTKRSGHSPAVRNTALRTKAAQHGKRGVHPPIPHEPGIGSLTIITPAGDGELADDQVRVEYASDGADVVTPAAPAEIAPEHAAAQVAAVIGGAVSNPEPSVTSTNAPSAPQARHYGGDKANMTQPPSAPLPAAQPSADHFPPPTPSPYLPLGQAMPMTAAPVGNAVPQPA